MIWDDIKILLVLMILFTADLAYSYDNEYIHPAVNEMAAKQSENITLRMHDLTFLKGIDSILNGKEIYRWLREGGKQEDIPDIRSNNHFHDPLRVWSAAGLKSGTLGTSSLVWAQEQSLGGHIVIGGDRSWKKARTMFYEGLTISDRGTREERLVYVFQSLGQIMHLIADVSVPAHVRNDIHVFPYELLGHQVGSRWQTYESWAKRRMTSNTTGVLNFAGVRPATDIFDRAVKTTAAPVAISALWDTDTYTGADIRTATGFNIGLAEYTNANFFSEDTIFRDYPHPTYDDTNYQAAMNSPVLVDAEDGKLDSRAYIKKTVGDADARLAAFSYISYDILKKGKIELSPFVLDDEVYKDYSALLIPRAVGYSAGLLNYFFRGDIRLGFETSPVAGYVFTNNTGEKMEGDFDIYYETLAETRAALWRGTGWIGPNEDRAVGIDFIPPADAKEGGKYIVVFKGKMGNEEGAVAGYVFHRLIEISPPERFVYSMIAADENPRQFIELRAKVRNTSNETIGSGSLQTVVKYKKTIDDETYSYIISGARPVSSLSETASEFTFDFRQEAIPIDATDVRLIIIFKGTIGQEQNALAMGERDISEPTPVDFFNNMDMVCINGSWYAAGSDAAIAQVGTNLEGKPNWDIYPHEIQDAYLKVSPGNAGKEAGPGDFTFHISSLKAGGFFRAYVLSEYEASHSSYVTKVIAAGDTWPHDIGQKTWPGAGLKNQVELHGDEGYCRTVGLPAPCYVDNRNVMYPFRGRQMWGSMGVIFDNPPFPPGRTCEWDALR